MTTVWVAMRHRESGCDADIPEQAVDAHRGLGWVPVDEWADTRSLDEADVDAAAVDTTTIDQPPADDAPAETRKKTTTRRASGAAENPGE